MDVEEHGPHYIMVLYKIVLCPHLHQVVLYSAVLYCAVGSIALHLTFHKILLKMLLFAFFCSALQILLNVAWSMNSYIKFLTVLRRLQDFVNDDECNLMGRTFLSVLLFARYIFPDHYLYLYILRIPSSLNLSSTSIFSLSS